MSSIAPALLERERPFKALEDARELAQQRGCIALVSGEAGIGKSSLVGAFTESLGHDTFVAYGRCDALFTPRVLGPVHDVAARMGEGLQARLESGANRNAAFAAFLEALRRLRAPVLVFEDVHWADEATLDLLKFIGRRIGETRALVILTYRDDELAPRHPLRMVVGELPRDRVVRVNLAPLSMDAVEKLVTPAAGEPVAPGKAGAQSGGLLRAKQLFDVTGGNPFYLTELLATGEEVPASVRDAVLARAARLSATARAAADLVSVAPGGLETAIVQDRVEDAVDAIAECEERGVLRSADGVLRFRHEIARLAVLEALGAERARWLNATVLAALHGRTAPGEQLARLAHHAEAAEEINAALHFSAEAARSAARLGSHREAAAHFRRAVKHAGRLDDVAHGDLLDEAAWEYHLAGRGDEAVAARDDALRLFRRAGDIDREAVALAKQAHLLVFVGRNPEAARCMAAALELVPHGTQRTRAQVYRRSCYLRMLERDVPEAIADSEQALALARAANDVESEAHALNTLGSTLLVSDDERGYGYLDQSLALARAHGLDYLATIAHANRGSAGGEVYRVLRAREDLEAGIAMAAGHDLDSSLQYQRAWLGLVHLFLGNWNAAAENAAAIVDQPHASAIARIMALLAMGRLRSRRGDPGAWEVLDEALTLSQGTGTLQRLAPVCAARAEAAWLAGEDSAAAREAAVADALARRKRHAWFVGELGYWQWKGGRAVDLPDYAAAPFALQVAGRWQEAAEAWKARACPFEQARALAEGDHDARLEALRIFDALGARPAAERLRRALRAAGVRRIPRGPRASTRAQPAGLTAREVQILGLLAENLTNAEIAARLHISAKTVDHHVSAVLAKLGVDSRREAARAARDLNWVGSPDVAGE